MKGDVYPVYGGSVNGEQYEETIMQDVFPALDEAARKLNSRWWSSRRITHHRIKQSERN
jgi:hypothetical protein